MINDFDFGNKRKICFGLKQEPHLKRSNPETWLHFSVLEHELE